MKFDPVDIPEAQEVANIITQNWIPQKDLLCSKSFHDYHKLSIMKLIEFS